MPSTEPSGMSRPIKINDDRSLKIVSAIRDGNTRATAAALAGISTRTLYDWMQRGKPDDETGEYPDDDYGKLHASVLVADAECERDLVASIRTASLVRRDSEGNAIPGDWKAALEFLQRKNPGEWGRVDRSKVELTGKDGGAVAVDVSGARDLLAAGLERLKPKPDTEDGA